MNPLKLIARTLALAATSVLPSGGGAVGPDMREERQRIKSSEQAAEFHRKLGEIVQSLPDGPRREAYARQCDAAKALWHNLLAREDHERLKGTVTAEIKAAQAEEAVEARAVEALLGAREPVAAKVSSLAQRLRQLQASLDAEAAKSQERVEAARAELAAVVAAGDVEQEARAAQELADARLAAQRNDESSASVRIAAVRSALEVEQQALEAASAAVAAARKALLSRRASVQRLKANAALIDATFAFAAWTVASRAAGLGSYSHPFNPFSDELSYANLPHKLPARLHREVMALPFDDDAFDVDASALVDDPATQEEPAVSPAVVHSDDARLRVPVPQVA